MGTAEDMDGVEAAVAGSPRRGQNIARSRRRRRRPNITGGIKHTVEVVLSDEEYTTVCAGAAEAGSTVPWYLVQCATHPVPAAAGDGESGRSGPWLPWPKRQALAATIASATGALDEIRLQHLAKIGSNLNQIAHSAHVTGVVGEDLAEVLGEVEEALAAVREHAEQLEELAREVTRR